MNFRLRAPQLDFYVDVRLRSFSGRWMAVAEIAGEREIGLASAPRDALAASLASLGPATTAALLADPQLIGLSSSVIEQQGK